MKLQTSTIQVVAAAALVACTAPGAPAASIVWSTGPTVNGPTGHLGILTNGALVEARHLAGAIGGSVTVDPGGLNITFTNVDSLTFPLSFGGATGGGNLDPGWAAILSSFEWNSGANVTDAGFLSGLTAGHAYQVQLIAARSDCCGDRMATFGDGAGNLSAAVRDDSYTSIVGTFVASGTTQTIEFIDSTNNPILNSYVLRDLTAVPEPGTWALMLGGLAAVGSLRRRRLG